MYCFVYFINILVKRRSRLNSRFKKRTRCHSFMALNRASNMSAADWLFQTHAKNYRNFSRVVIRLFSEVKIPIKHSSLYNKYQLKCMLLTHLFLFFDLVFAFFISVFFSFLVPFRLFAHLLNLSLKRAKVDVFFAVSKVSIRLYGHNGEQTIKLRIVPLTKDILELMQERRRQQRECHLKTKLCVCIIISRLFQVV